MNYWEVIEISALQVALGVSQLAARRSRHQANHGCLSLATAFGMPYS